MLLKFWRNSMRIKSLAEQYFRWRLSADTEGNWRASSGLIYKENLQNFAERIVIVFKSHSTSYGEHVTKKISWELAEVGFTIVTCSAFRIDTYVHLSAMKFWLAVVVLLHVISQIPGNKKKLIFVYFYLFLIFSFLLFE